MIKKSEKYEHPGTGIVFEVSFDNTGEMEKKKLTIKNSKNRHDFTFINSDLNVVNKIAKALWEISEFADEI